MRYNIIVKSKRIPAMILPDPELQELADMLNITVDELKTMSLYEYINILKDKESYEGPCYSCLDD